MVNKEDLPTTDSEVINVLWNLQIFPGLHDLEKAKAVVESYKPPTEEALWEYIEGMAKTNPDVFHLLKELKVHEDHFKSIKQELEDYGNAHLLKPANADERAAAALKARHVKNRVVSSIHALWHQAKQENETEVEDFCRDLLGSLEPRKKSSVSTDSMKARKWLRENHPELNVSTKGKISDKAYELYLNRDRSEEEG